MKKISSYKTLRNAQAALDNGGRLFNIFTDSDDGEIEASEFGKIAGVIKELKKDQEGKEKASLYLDALYYSLPN